MMVRLAVPPIAGSVLLWLVLLPITAADAIVTVRGLGYALQIEWGLAFLSACFAVAINEYLIKRHEPEIKPETYCRYCGHILRGLSAPRCPECGRSI